MTDSIRHVTIRGLVQGVGYRAWTSFEADGHGLTGWVRNRRDRSVEAVFAGPRDAVDAMIAACRRGPIAARVDSVDVEDAGTDMLGLAPAGRFTQLPTL